MMNEQIIIDYTYAGLQKGGECWCGDHYNTDEKAPEAYCNLECPGHRLKKCGGAGFNSIYLGISSV